MANLLIFQIIHSFADLSKVLKSFLLAKFFFLNYFIQTINAFFIDIIKLIFYRNNYFFIIINIILNELIILLYLNSRYKL